MKSHPHADAIDEAASLWASRIEGGDMIASDRQALAAWLQASPQHRSALESYHLLSDHIGAHLDGLFDTAMEAATQTRVRTRRRVRVTTSCLAVAATIAMVAIFLVNRPRQLVTRIGERHLTSLRDGSRLELNAQTTVEVDFSRAERRVRLLRGEALFTVARDAARPFVVATPTGVVRVTGTVFNIRAVHAERAEVTVLEGTVRVSAAHAGSSEQALTPGFQAIVRSDRVEVKSLPEGSVQDTVAWRQGQAVFDDTPLAEAIERFASYHVRAIVVDDDIAGLRLGGRYSLDDLEGLLESIESVLPVRVTHGADGIIRLSARPPG